MRKKINILVTGCGGDIGQSIGRILSKQAFVNTLIGTDLNKKHYGIFIFDEVEIVSPCDSKDYFSDLKKICERQAIDLIIPASEPEIKTLFENGFLKTFNGTYPVLMASEKALKIGFDKLNTVNFLKEKGFPYPQTSILGNTSFTGQSVIVKSRFGSGGKEVFKVNDLDKFKMLKELNPSYLVQEYLTPDDQEYTCCLFRTSKGQTRTLILKRKLVGDTTGYAITIKNKQIKKLLIEIGELMSLVGSINIQLRLTESGPIIFEINPRFSSTVQFRHLLNFKDLVWSAQDYFHDELSSYKECEGIEMFRGYTYKIK